MSASIYWQPTKIGTRLGILHPQHFIEQCNKVFGNFPLVLTTKDLDKIETLVALNNQEDCPWKQIIKLLETHPSIKIWDEY